MRADLDRQRYLVPTQSGGHRVASAPSQRAFKTRKETMSGIWCSPALKPKSATWSGQRTTTSTPNIISDQCARTQKGRKRPCYDGRSRSGAAFGDLHRDFQVELLHHCTIQNASRDTAPSAR